MFSAGIFSSLMDCNEQHGIGKQSYKSPQHQEIRSNVVFSLYQQLATLALEFGDFSTSCQSDVDTYVSLFQTREMLKYDVSPVLNQKMTFTFA
jgi:hypothetical protein